MSMAREDEAGHGTGGKFRKRRNQAATPYDRPAAAVWLSKLITGGAHRLFSSVFRHRLPPPPEGRQEPRDGHKEAISSDPPGVREAHIDANNPSNSSNSGGLTELEQILKHKTFTRSEVDQLTSLLRSRSYEMPVEGEEKRSEKNWCEVMSSKLMAFNDRKKGYLNTPLRENGIQNHLASTSVVNKAVLDENVASPTEVAKAFMGSSLSKVSPSAVSLRNKAIRDESTVTNSPSSPPKSSILSLVQKSHVAVPANGFLAPRSRGRYAIYNMARTPYSRVQQTSTFKDAGAMINSFGSPSSSMSSQYDGAYNRTSGSQQGALKRRSSVFENDVGSVEPMRRIRQKSNLMSRKDLSSPVNSQDSSSSVKMVTENGDIGKQGSSFTPTPFKSTKMASNILEHLEKFTPKEKSPTKLSPSMLRGKALRSLENPDSSKVFENVQHNSKLDDLVNSSAPDIQQSTSVKNDQDDTKGSTKLPPLFGKVASAENGADGTVSVKATMPTVNADDLKNTISHSPPKKQGFKMSANEDFLDLEDDIISNEVSSTPSTEAREKLGNYVSERNTMVPEVVKADKLPDLSEADLSTGFILNQKPDLGASDGSAVTEKNTGPVDSPPEVSESAEALTRNNLKPEVLSKTPEPCPDSTSMPVAAVVAFGGADNSSLNNGSLSSSPTPLSSSVPPLFSSSTTFSSATLSTASTSASTATTSSSLPVNTLVSSLPATQIPKFGSSSAPSNSIVPASGAPGVETAEGNVKQGTSFGNIRSTPYGVPVAAPNTDSGNFGFSASSPSAISQSQGSTPSGGSSVSPSSSVAMVTQSMPVQFSFSSSVPPSCSSGVATVTKSMPVQFGSSDSSAFSSTRSLSGTSATAATLFSSGWSSFALSSSGSAVSSSSGTASSLFVSSWQQPTKSPIFPSFNTTSSYSTGFSFGAISSVATTNGSSSTAATNNSTPMMPFGPSLTSSASPFSYKAANGTSSSSVPAFSFTSATSQPPVFGFGNSDQMNMEDSSMAEDTVQASTVPTFSQKPFSPMPSTSTPFQFGGQQTFSPIPFQFGGQQASPFQASASLDFNASGNFSLGTGGGGGGDKSNRKIVKVKGKYRRK